MSGAKEDLLSRLLVAYDGDLNALAADIKLLASKKQKTKTKNSPDYSSKPIVAKSSSVTRIYNKGKDNEVIALDSVDLQIHEGEMVALVGPSGSGKSTLLNTFAGLDKPTSGDISVAGKSLKSMSDKQLSRYRNQQIGFVFQFFYLQPFLNLQTNIEVPAMFARTPKSERRDYSTEVIEAVGLGDRRQHLPKELSGGQMQRSAIARALVNKPRLLIADEPTGNLDSENAAGIMELFDKIRLDHDMAILIVTHDESIAAMADRVVRLKDGRVLK